MPGKVWTKPHWVYLLTPIFCTFIYTLRSIDLADTMTIICTVNQTKMDSNWLFVCGTVPFRNPKPHPPQRAFISGKASKHRCEGCLAFVAVNWCRRNGKPKAQLVVSFHRAYEKPIRETTLPPKTEKWKICKAKWIALGSETNERPTARPLERYLLSERVFGVFLMQGNFCFALKVEEKVSNLMSGWVFRLPSHLHSIQAVAFPHTYTGNGSVNLSLLEGLIQHKFAFGPVLAISPNVEEWMLVLYGANAGPDTTLRRTCWVSKFMWMLMESSPWSISLNKVYSEVL